MTFVKRDMQKMLCIFESFLKSGAWQAVIFPQAQMYLHLHISQKT